MTVPYSKLVATSSFSCFLRLLFRWRGSIYKLLWKEFAVFALLYYFLSFTYRFWLNEKYKRVFEMLSVYCQEFVDLIPLAFVLGFYVSVVVGRFWEQFNAIPWPTRMALFVSALITGIDERGRLMRRTIMRYLCLSQIITMSAISPPVKKRFPTYQQMTEAGFMLENEQRIIENMSTATNKYFVPLVWSASLVLRARKEGRIKDDFAVKTLIDEINDYRGKCGTLFAYDHVSIPIVYTQVVTIAVYMFFMSCLMGRQFLEKEKHGDLYFPLFTFLQFFFYMGWLKVAESLVNPFGEDDDDFEINSMIDSNLPNSYLIVDEMHNEHPELLKDQYWESFNREIVLPYTEDSLKFQTKEFLGSAANINVGPVKAMYHPSVASNMDQMGSQLSMAPSALGRKTPSMARKLTKRLDRSTSRMSQMFKSSFSRASSRLEVTKETDENAVPLKETNPKLEDHEKLLESRKEFPSDLMFRMSVDEESTHDSPITMQAFDDQSGKAPFMMQDVDSQSQKTSFMKQVDPFISKHPAKEMIKKRTTSVSSIVSNDSKNRIEINFDGKEVESPTKETVPLVIPASSPTTQTDSQSPLNPSFIATTAPTSTTVTQPSPRSTQHTKAAPTTSVRVLDPVIEAAESVEAFSGDVMDKLKEMRENK